MPEVITFRVGEEDSGKRLDVFLSEKISDTSRSVIKRWIQSSSVRVGDQAQKPSYALTTGESVEVVPPPPQPVELVPENIPLDFLYQDSEIAVINKPAGLIVHPGAGNLTGTLANALVFHFQLPSGDQLRPGIVHRLDQYTSGVMVVAKDDRSQRKLSAQFKKRRVEKRYLALLYGNLENSQGSIEIALGRDPYQRTKISTRSRYPRQALTRYKVLKHYEEVTLVLALPETGRTHQIRVHFQYLGHPVVGDETYGVQAHQSLRDSDLVEKIENLGRHFLHASFLAFTHPGRGQWMKFEAPLPEELARLIKTLEE